MPGRNRYDPTIERLPEEPADFAAFVAGIPDVGLRRIAGRVGELQARAWQMYAELKPRLLQAEASVVMMSAQLAALTDRVAALEQADVEPLPGPDAAG